MGYPGNVGAGFSVAQPSGRSAPSPKQGRAGRRVDGTTVHEDGEAFYERSGADAFAPTRATTSAWDDALQHGSPPTALLARMMTERHPRDDMRIARIGVEFLGPIPRSPVVVRTRVVRPGKRIELLEGVLEANGREIVTARVWRIATKPAGTVPPGSTTPDAVPPVPAEETLTNGFGITDWGYAQAFDWRFVRGGLGTIVGPAAVWTRVRIPLIAGEPQHALDRLLLVVDSANGISAELSPREWLFVPPTIALALTRYPDGEWTFMEARTQLSEDGIGVTSARYGDRHGYLGAGTQALLVEPRPR